MNRRHGNRIMKRQNIRKQKKKKRKKGPKKRSKSNSVGCRRFHGDEAPSFGFGGMGRKTKEDRRRFGGQSAAPDWPRRLSRNAHRPVAMATGFLVSVPTDVNLKKKLGKTRYIQFEHTKVHRDNLGLYKLINFLFHFRRVF